MHNTIARLSGPFMHKEIPLTRFELGSHIIPVSAVVKNIGRHLDTNQSMEHNISKIIKKFYFHLSRNQNFYYSTPTGQENNRDSRLVHAFITSRLDCFNCILFDISKFLLPKLQRLQNSPVLKQMASWALVYNFSSAQDPV